MGHQNHSLLNSLIAWWDLDEVSGTRVDAHGANDLTDNNTVTQAAGVSAGTGDAAQFTLANAEYLSRANNPEMSTGDIDFTFAGWVYLDSFGSVLSTFVNKWDDTSAEYRIAYNVGSARFDWSVRKTDNSAPVVLLANSFGAPALSTWYFLVAGYDAVNDFTFIQVNNGTVDTAALAGGVRVSTNPFRLGTQELNRFLDGREDSWGFWKRILTPAEKTELYNGGAGLRYADIIPNLYFVASTVAGAGGYLGPANSVTVNKPTGTLEGHLMVMVLSRLDNIEAVTAPAGWTQRYAFSNTAADPTIIQGIPKIIVYDKVATGAEPADYAFSWASNARAQGSLLTYNGATSIAGGATNEIGSSTSLSADSPGGDCLAVFAVANSSNDFDFDLTLGPDQAERCDKATKHISVSVAEVTGTPGTRTATYPSVAVDRGSWRGNQFAFVVVGVDPPEPVPIPIERRVGGLGECPIYVAQLTRRGGSPVLLELPWSGLDYGRALDEMTSGSVTVPATTDENCCRVLGEVRAWEHELVIWRDGASMPDWAGPIIEPVWTRDSVTLRARDLFQWLERRELSKDYNPIQDDPVGIFERFFEDAMFEDTSPNITLVIQGPAGFVAERVVLASEHRIAADELRELGRTGVDWTMRGRELLVRGENLALPFIGIVNEEDIDNPEVSQRGLEAASLIVVKGSAGVVTQVGGVDVDMGLVTRVFTELTVRDGESVDHAADTLLSILNPAPEVFQFDLNHKTTILRESLVPGALIDVRARLACREFSRLLRLTSLAVNVSASDSGPTETVSLTCVPVGL